MVITKLNLSRRQDERITTHPHTSGVVCVTCWQEKRLASLWAENKRIEAMA